MLWLPLNTTLAATRQATGPARQRPRTSRSDAAHRSGSAETAMNSGHAPRDAYDPGGWGQYAVFFGIVFGVGLIALLIWRDVRKGRRRQAARESTRSDPVAETSENSPDSSARQ